MFTDSDVTAFLGASMPGLTPGIVSAAVVAVRRYCRWHIAPEQSDLVRINVDGRTGRLPSLHVVDVVSVTAADTGAPLSVRWSAEGSISGDLPQGFRTVDVEFVHGFSPADVADVLGVVVSICRRLAAGALAATAGQVGPVVREQIGAYQYGLSDPFARTLGQIDLLETEKEMLAQYRISEIV